MSVQRLKSDPMDERVETRRGKEIPAILYREDGSRIGVNVSDLSYQGFKLSCHVQLAIGEQVKLVIMQLGSEEAAIVKWATATEAGAYFANQP